MQLASMLHGKVIAVPETRQLDVLAGLLERRGATVRRCPLVRIKDTPDRGPVMRWLSHFIARPPRLIVLYTGEGLTRLLRFADDAGLREKFVEALGHVHILSRGPKPAKVLRQISLRPTSRAEPATTEGVIQALDSIDIGSTRVAVQLYGSDPNVRLMQYLGSRSAKVDCVAPYIYADESDKDDVRDLICKLYAGLIDMIAFTSKTQVERLIIVANESGLESQLSDGLRDVSIATVGPVVRDFLEERGYKVAVSPSERHFLKPLVQAIVDAADAGYGRDA